MKIAKLMTCCLTLLLALAISGVFTTAALADDDDNTFKLYWKDGIKFDSKDGKFKMKFGGRLMNDHVFFSADQEVEDAVNDGEEIVGGTEFRRARLYVSGTVYGRIGFKAQYDFAGGDADMKDVWLSLQKVGFLGDLKFGHFKEPFSLEELTSSKYITFMERSLPLIFAPSRNTGIGIHNSPGEHRMTYALGIFRDTDDYAEYEGEDWSYTGRITALPVKNDNALIHVGAAFSVRDFTSVRYRQRPEIHISPRFVDTHEFDALGDTRLGLELAGVFGPFSLQGEWIQTKVDSAEMGDPTFDGYYVFASYYFTGESRSYKDKNGAFDRTKVKNSVFAGGPGAWELALRYSSLNLNDAEVMGGEVSDVTVGLNWHLNNNTRFMLNYIMADLNDQADEYVGGNADIIGLRFQLDF